MKIAQKSQVEVDSKPFATFMPKTLAMVASGKKTAANMSVDVRQLSVVGSVPLEFPLVVQEKTELSCGRPFAIARLLASHH